MQRLKDGLTQVFLKAMFPFLNFQLSSWVVYLAEKLREAALLKKPLSRVVYEALKQHEQAILAFLNKVDCTARRKLADVLRDPAIVEYIKSELPTLLDYLAQIIELGCEKCEEKR